MKGRHSAVGLFSPNLIRNNKVSYINRYISYSLTFIKHTWKEKHVWHEHVRNKNNINDLLEKSVSHGLCNSSSSSSSSLALAIMDRAD